MRHTIPPKEFHAPQINQAAAGGKPAQPQISAQLLEELIPGPVTTEEFEDIFQNFKKAFIGRASKAEMDHQLGYGPAQAKPEGGHPVVYPSTTLQACIVHLMRNSLDYASWKERKPLAATINPSYTAPSAEAALAELDAFESSPWGRKFSTSANIQQASHTEIRTLPGELIRNYIREQEKEVERLDQL